MSDDSRTDASDGAENDWDLDGEATPQHAADTEIEEESEGTPQHAAGAADQAGMSGTQRFRTALLGRGGGRQILIDVVTTFFAFVLAFVVGGILMIVSDPEVSSKFAYFFGRPGDALQASADKVFGAYGALARGALGGIGPITETTAQAAPLICAGLGVALAFRAGLFNIGGQGQAIWGAILSAWVGFSLPMPIVLQCVAAVVLGIFGGAVWGGLVGLLKAKAGAHEVIVTIMLNYIAAGMLAYLLTTTAFQRPGRTDPISPVVDWNATFARIEGTRLHLGFLLALLAAVGVWFLLERTSIGFAIRAVGANPHASATAGMSVARTTIFTMAIAGGLAGLGGVMSSLGPTVTGFPDPLSAGLVGSVGFDAITVALLGRSKPVGTVLAGLLFGALHAGGLAMQSQAGTPLTLTIVLQALIVIFVAAPALVTSILPFIKGRPSTPNVPAGALS